MSDPLIEFWSNIENVKNASPEDIQSDVLAYLKQREMYKKMAQERAEALFFYADEQNYRQEKAMHGDDDFYWEAPEILEDGGERARTTLRGRSA